MAADGDSVAAFLASGMTRGRNGHSVWILAPEFGGPRDPGQVGTLLSVSVLPILKMAIAMFATVSLCKL